MLNPSCPAPQPESNKKKPKYGESQIRKATEWYRKTFGVSSNIDAVKAAELDALDAQEIYARHLAEMGAVNPEEFNRVSSFIAAQFNQINKALGLSPNALSAEGQLRLNFLDVRRVANSLVNNVIKLHQVQTLKRIITDSKSILSKYGIKGNKAMEMINDVFEYAFIPDKSIAYDSDVARRFNTLRYDKWKASMLDLGISEADFNSLVSQAYEFASIPRNIREAARKLGVPVGDQDGIGYFTRVATDDFKMRFAELEKDPNLYDDLIAGHTLFSTVFNKARTTQHYAPSAAIDLIAALINKVVHKDVFSNLEAQYKGSKEAIEAKYKKAKEDVRQKIKEERRGIDEVKARGLYDEFIKEAKATYESEVKKTNEYYSAKKKEAAERLKMRQLEDSEALKTLEEDLRTQNKATSRKQKIRGTEIKRRVLIERNQRAAARNVEYQNTLKDIEKQLGQETEALKARYEGEKNIARQKVKEERDKVAEMNDAQREAFNAKADAQKQEVLTAQEKELQQLEELYTQQKNKVGTSPQEITKLIDDPLKWREFLDSLPDHVVDTLVESGMLQQIPMTSKEVFEFFVKKYNLAYTSRSEMFVTNPELAVTEYAKSLGRAAGNSRIFSYVSTRGIEEGWSMSRDGYQAAVRNGEFPFETTQDDWVKLGDLDWRSTGIDPQTIKNRENIYVHRNVGEQLLATMYIASNPAAMSNVGSGIQKLSSMFRLSILAKEGWRYASRVAMSGVIQAFRGTGFDPRAVPVWFQAMTDVTRVMMGKEGLGFLDDTEPVIKAPDGKMYTRRAAFIELATYRFSEFAPLTPGDSIEAVGDKTQWLKRVFRMYSPRTIQQALHFAASTTKPGQGAIKYSKQFGKYYFAAARDSLEAWLAPFATFANASDIATRWTVLQLQGEVRGNSWQDFFRYTDDLTPSSDSTGKFAKQWGNFFLPFSGYAMWNPPATIRQALREPHKFVAYHKLLSLYSRNGSKPCNDAPEAAFPSWMNKAYPVLVGCDGKDPLVMNIQALDPQSDALVYFRETGEAVTGMLGGFGGSTEEQRQQTIRDGVSQFFNSQLDKSYWKGAIELATNRSLETGQEFKEDVVTWNGIEMLPRIKAFFQSVPIPGLPAPFVTFDEFNRQNPFGVLGRKEVRDSNGNVVRPEQLSFLNTRRADADARYDDAVARSATLSLLRNLGVSINVARVAENMQFSEGRIEGDLMELKRVINRETNKYLEEYNKYPEGERKKRYEHINQMAQQAALIEIDLMRVRQWMRQKGIPPKEVFEKYREAVRRSQGEAMYSGGIPMPSVKGQTDVLNQYYDTIKKLSHEQQRNQPQ